MAEACSTQDCGDSEADSGLAGEDHEDSNEGLRCERCDHESLSAAAAAAHSLSCPIAPGTRKMFECDVCQMKFSNGANMRRHKMRHTGVKPYECRVCQKRFFRKDHLAEHFTTHTKTLPFHCPICNRGFQRQIAMRAHFQNEHVGQNDVVKSCPLCAYSANSMKSLRVHFFNRHGIDLDRPSGGDGGAGGGGGSDSGDSARSADNATPPMHFLTPHVEISMADPPPPSYSPSNQIQDQTTGGSSDSGVDCKRVNGESPGSPQSGDSNTPSSSSGGGPEVAPSVSLIPIKQEAPPEEEHVPPAPVNLSVRPHVTSLIKVSPLKSLLREEVRPSSTVWEGALSRRLNCTFCGIGFPDQTLYFLHKGCHSESNPWKCNICGEQCSNVYDFNSHLLSKTHQ